MPDQDPSPLSSHFSLEGDLDCWDRVTEVLEMIDSVHVDGTTGPIKVVAYAPPEGGFGYFDEGDAELGLNEDCEQLESTLAHEVGHVLDSHGFGPGTSVCASHPEFEAWRTAVMESRTFKRLENMRDTSKADVIIEGNEETYDLDDEEQEHVEYYLLDWAELWARSYCQYISTRIGDLSIAEQLAREAETEYGQLYQPQWQQEEFQPIDQAVQDVIEAKWMRPSKDKESEC